MAGFRGYGTLTKVRISGVYTTIPGVTNATRSGGTRDQIETTSQDSTGGYREFISGLKTGGTLNLDMNDLPQDTVQKYLRAAYESGSTELFQVVKSDTSGTTGAFSGQVEQMEDQMPVDGKLSVRVVIRITGPITWTP